MKKLKLILYLLFLIPTSFAYAQNVRPLWVWNSTNVVGDTSEENILLNECISSVITDLYLYSGGSLMSGGDTTSLRSFIARANCLNIKVWGLDGWRGYYSDLCGPAEYYANIQAVINYNALSASNERFVGFNGDNEFQVNESSSGCGPGNGFHTGYTDAQLSTTSGGLWMSSARADRDSLMSDCVKQAAHAAAICHAGGIRYSIAMMPWITGISYTSSNMGNQTTPLMALYNGTTKPLYKHLLDYVDQYVIMSYHTNVSGKVVNMCKDVLTYADSMSVSPRPQILSGIETGCGIGEYVSYCDTPGDNTKTYVLSAMTLHRTDMGSHVSYSGQAIDSWSAWKSLPTASNNTSTPPVCTTTSISTVKTKIASQVSYDAASGTLVIKSGATPSCNGEIALIGMDGRVLFQTPFTIANGTAKITLPVVRQGCYIYSLMLTDGNNQSGKLIVVN
jgi:hypothetical protein